MNLAFLSKIHIGQDDKAHHIEHHGLLIAYSDQCDVVFLTDGRYGAQDSTPPSDMVSIRKKEAQFVSNLLKINRVYFH